MKSSTIILLLVVGTFLWVVVREPFLEQKEHATRTFNNCIPTEEEQTILKKRERNPSGDYPEIPIGVRFAQMVNRHRVDCQIILEAQALKDKSF